MVRTDKQTRKRKAILVPAMHAHFMCTRLVKTVLNTYEYCVASVHGLSMGQVSSFRQAKLVTVMTSEIDRWPSTTHDHDLTSCHSM